MERTVSQDVEASHRKLVFECEARTYTQLNTSIYVPTFLFFPVALNSIVCERSEEIANVLRNRTVRCRRLPCLLEDERHSEPD